MPSEIPPILLCYEGISFNTIAFTSGRLDRCYGDCAQLTVAGQVGGSAMNATFYMCDPVGMCNNFQVLNGCRKVNVTGIDADITACCCNRDRCNSPDAGPITPIPTIRQCFTGVSVPSMTFSRGGVVMCNGQCANITVTVGASNTPVVLYTCDPFAVCTNLNLENRCKYVDLIFSS